MLQDSPTALHFSPAMRRGRPVVVALLGLAVVTLRANRDEWLSFAPWPCIGMIISSRAHGPFWPFGPLAL